MSVSGISSAQIASYSNAAALQQEKQAAAQPSQSKSLSAAQQDSVTLHTAVKENSSASSLSASAEAVEGAHGRGDGSGTSEVSQMLNLFAEWEQSGSSSSAKSSNISTNA